MIAACFVMIARLFVCTLFACLNTFVCLLPITSYNAVVSLLKISCLLETKPCLSVTTLLAAC
jgi:hypothetical protein